MYLTHNHQEFVHILKDKHCDNENLQRVLGYDDR